MKSEPPNEQRPPSLVNSTASKTQCKGKICEATLANAGHKVKRKSASDLPFLRDQLREEFEEEVDTLSRILNKYATQNFSGNWLKLRAGVLSGKTNLWSQPARGLLDIAVIIDALWDEYKRRNKEGQTHAS
jgi:hypothetical protein